MVGVVLGRGLGRGRTLGVDVGRGPVVGVVLGRGLVLGRALGVDVGKTTLGGGVRIIATLGAVTGGVSCGSAGGVLTTLGTGTVGLSTATAKILASWRRACNWLSPSAANGVAGVGFNSACVRSLAASRAASADDVLGMTEWKGKNSTVLAMRSEAVLVA